jgi:hypothetical protein
MTSSALAIRLIVPFAVVVGLSTTVSMPPRTIRIPPGGEVEEPVRGVVHVHSRLSDGTGTVDQIAEAAARAGLRFVVITDHGDATRPPQPPAYRSGVLCIDAVEVTTTGGHLLALGLWSGAPYRLGGDPRDVAEDVARLGGVSVAAHPDSRKPSLRWTDWEAPVDGLEWLNADSEWRDEGVGALARALFTYPWRKSETLAALLDYPQEAIRSWDVLSERRRIVGLAAADAHASLGVETASPVADSGSWLAVPGYDHVFRTFSIALPSLRLTGDAAMDARRVIEEIRAGHLYTSIDALASPARLAFTATSGEHTAQGGDELAVQGPVTLRVRVSASDARIALVSRGRVVSSASGPALEHQTNGDRAAYRVEVRLRDAPQDGSRVPWLLSNPIYVGGVEQAVNTKPAPPVETHVVYSDGGPFPGRWSIEKHDTSEATINASGGAPLEFAFTLAGRPDDDPWAAAIVRTGPELQRFDRLMFSARADKPMRLWVQVRTPEPATRLYWRRSIYLDATERQFSLRFDEMRSLDGSAGAPVAADVESIMFVIDQINTAVGTSGRVWLDDVRYGR